MPSKRQRADKTKLSRKKVLLGRAGLTGAEAVIERITSQHYAIAKCMSEFLLPLDLSEAPLNLSNLTKSSRTIHAAFAPFLFRTINLRRFGKYQSHQEKHAKSVILDEVFFANMLIWRPQIYNMVQHLVFPEKLHKTIYECLQFAVRLPNLEVLFLPYDASPGWKVPNCWRWTNLKVLGCGNAERQLLPGLTKPSIKTVHLMTYAIWCLKNRRYLPLKYPPRSPPFSTLAETIYISGRMQNLYHTALGDFDWNQCAPNTKEIGMECDHIIGTDSPMTPTSLPPVLTSIQTLERLALYLPRVNPQFLTDDSKMRTTVGTMTSISELTRTILDLSLKNGGFAALQEFYIAVQFAQDSDEDGPGIEEALLSKAEPVGIAIALAENCTPEWQRQEFAFWSICTARKDAEGSWTYAEKHHVMWKRDPDYPFILRLTKGHSQ